MVLRWFAALAVLPALSSAVLCQSYSATELYAFKAYGTGDANIPSPALIQASDGNYYGASYFGGMNANAGAIFRITPTGEESVVYGFCAQANCADGYMPSSLVEASDGNLYGTTIEYNKIDNTTYVGHIFRVNPISGAYTTLHAFTTVEPYYGGPVNIMQGSDGNLYGTTGSGSSLGSIWSLTLGGTFTTLYYATSNFNTAGGSLLEASDGLLYGVNTAGNGGIFSIHKDGSSFENLYFFCAGKYCTDGAGPISNLVEGADGALYGTTTEGGVNGTSGTSADGSIYGEGVVYRFSGLSESVLYAFCAVSATCTDGARPEGNIQLGGDGAIYGLTSGTPYAGSIPGFFRTTEDGSSTTTLALAVGQSDGGIVGAANSNMIASTQRGGAPDEGDVLSIDTSTAVQGIKPPISIAVTPSQITPGQSAKLTWKVNNAYSNTASYCFATSNDGEWTGLKAVSGSVTLKPGAGTFSYALTCGGTVTSVAELVVAVPQLIPTTTVLTANPTIIAQGANATLSAKVTAQSGPTPTGSVTFYAQGESLATVNLTNGVASLTASTASIALGNYAVTAKYSGNATDAASTSAAVTVSVRNGSTTSLSITPDPVSAGANATISVTVKATTGTVKPTGTVKFSAEGESLFNLTLSNGAASITLSTKGYAAGTYPILAAYAGDANYAPSSVTVNETVK